MPKLLSRISQIKIQEKSYVWTNKCSWIIYLTTLPVPLTGNTKERNRQLLIFTPHGVVPARMVAPLLKSLAKEYKDQIAVYKVDTDKQKELSAVMGIQSLPTIIFIPKTGQPQIIIGAANKATFRKAIEEVLLKE